MADSRSETGIKSVQLTLDIIEHIAADSEVGVSDLSARLNSTKGTIYRHLQTLVERGYVSQNAETSRYRLGIRSFLLGQAAADRIDLLTAAGEAVKALVDETGQTAVLSTVTTGGVTVLRTALGRPEVEIGVRPGSVLALHASSQGKVAVAYTPALHTQLRSGKLQRYTEFTITDPAVLEREISLIQERGWANAPEELLLGLNSVAAPVFNSATSCIATLAIVGSIQFVRRTPDPTQVRAVKDAARQISRALGASSARASGAPSK